MALVHSLDLRLLSLLCKNLTDFLQKKVYRFLYWPSVAHKATGVWPSVTHIATGFGFPIAHLVMGLIFWTGIIFNLEFVLQTDIGRIGLQRQIG